MEEENNWKRGNPEGWQLTQLLVYSTVVVQCYSFIDNQEFYMATKMLLIIGSRPATHLTITRQRSLISNKTMKINGVAKNKNIPKVKITVGIEDIMGIGIGLLGLG